MQVHNPSTKKPAGTEPKATTKTNDVSGGSVIYLAGEDLRVAASLLFQSYKDDPIFQEIFKAEKDGYEQRLRAAIREELNVFWQSGQSMFGVYDGDTLEGVVCITRPDNAFGPGRFWHWRLKMLLTAGYLSTQQMLEKERLVAKAVPYENYLLLAFIAVHPRYQHKGLGHLLVSAVNTILRAESDAEGVVALATRAEYESFLAHQGYAKLSSIQLGKIEGSVMVCERDTALAQTAKAWNHKEG